MMELSDFVLSFINKTHRNIFLTGKAGTGKTTLLHRIIKDTHKNTAVVAPTGIAAINAKGTTIHSLFQIPPGMFLPDDNIKPTFQNHFFLTPSTIASQIKLNQEKKKLLKNLELLVIDEVSMLRCDLLDMMDEVLKNVRKNSYAFGGVQVLFIGDLLQLPPVVRQEEWSYLQNYYKGVFFFHARVLQNNQPLYVELDKIYRQDDSVFISILNNLRHNILEEKDIKILNQYVKPNFKASKNDGYITLTTHNSQADAINQKEMERLEGKSFEFQAEIIDNFPPSMYPIEASLILKKDAQVMFIKNDISAEKKFYNGKIGQVVSISDQEIIVKLDGEDTLIDVPKYEWQNVNYVLDPLTNKVKEEVLGTFTQYPLRTAWAITVHKSQGLTFEKAVLNLGQVFAPGQAYVALSRLKSLNGLVLRTEIKTNDLQTSADVVSFSKNKQEKENLTSILNQEELNFIKKNLFEAFYWQEMSSVWKILEESFKTESKKSKKYAYVDWTLKRNEKIQQIYKNSCAFIKELYQLFEKNSTFDFISERFFKAKHYFMPILEEILLEVMVTKEKESKSRMSKKFCEDLDEIETNLFLIISNLIKVEGILNAFKNKEDITKDSEFVKKVEFYKPLMVQKMRKIILQEELFVEEKNDFQENSSEKQEKISTYEKTFLLWQKSKSLEDISKERKLSLTTIYGHIGVLISEGKIRIEEMLSPEQIKELSEIFSSVEKETTLTQIREMTNEKISWETLRMFKNYWDKKK